MAKKNKTVNAPVKPVYPMSIETFRDVGGWELNSMRDFEPSAMNGWVRFKKYKVTVDIIEEPIEVYQERLEYLWVTCDNHHNYSPIKHAALSIGYELKGEFGSQRKK